VQLGQLLGGGRERGGGFGHGRFSPVGKNRPITSLTQH
jgi:hypothetical protein